MIWNAAATFGLIFGAFLSSVILIRAYRRRRMFQVRALSPPAFDSSELHAMQASGELSPEETARVAAATARQQAAQDSSPPPGPRGFEVLPIVRK